MVYWSIGLLVYWTIGGLFVYWTIGLLVYWCTIGGIGGIGGLAVLVVDHFLPYFSQGKQRG